MEFRVLGPLELCADERRLDIGAAKQRALLALLLLDPNQVVGRDRLIEQLWDGAPPRAAKATLHSCVYRLRKLLSQYGAESGTALHTRPTGYLLEVPPEAVDLRRFEQLVERGGQALDAGQPDAAVQRWRTGLELWRGEAFADIGLVAVRDRAVRLDEIRLDITERCLTAELSLGRHDVVIAEVESLVTQHPLRERLWELLITALYRSGRQADALDTYQRLYKLLDTELAVEPGRSIRDLHEQILRSDPELDAPSGPETTPPPIPRQLPAAVGDFTGREADLDRLDAILPDAARSDPDPGTAPTVVISAIAGTAGIGKTALAVHWAHRVADRFPDGQLYVNLRGFDPSGPAMDPAEALRGFLDALRVPPERMPTDLDARVGLYRSLLADRRILLLLDNARDADQVRPLLPGTPGSLVLVTSRNQLSSLVAAEGARPLRLDLLPTAEARQFLERRIGTERAKAEPAAVDDIIESCARLPLALAVAAARAVTHPDFPLDALATELHQARGGLDAFAGADASTDVRSVFSWSYWSLSDNAARLFRLLGPYAGPDISMPAAASLVGLPIGRTRPLLYELARAHLLTEHAPGKYGFHDLLRAYASELLDAHDDEAVRQSAVRRLLDHYLHTGYAAATLLFPQRDALPPQPAEPGVVVEQLGGHGQALAWFTTERPVLLSAVGLAADSGFDPHACQLAAALVEFLDRQGHWTDLASTQRIALAAAERLGDLGVQASTHRYLGAVQVRLGRSSHAHPHFQYALELSQQLGDHTGEAHTHRTYAWVIEQEGDYPRALRHARRAMELFQVAGHRTGEASALNDAGWYHSHLGDHEHALTYCRQALTLFQELEHRHGQAATWESLGFANAHLGYSEHAMTCYQYALDLYRDLGIRYYEAETLNYLGDVYHDVHDHGMASVIWEQALSIFADLDHVRAEQVRAKLQVAKPTVRVASTVGGTVDGAFGGAVDGHVTHRSGRTIGAS